MLGDDALISRKAVAQSEAETRAQTPKIGGNPSRLESGPRF